MPGTNNFTLIAPAVASNVITDAELKSQTNWEETGIDIGEVAYSNRMNTVLRQITTVTHSMADLVANELNVTVGSYADVGISQINESLLRQTFSSLILALAPNKTTTRVKNTIWAGPSTGVDAAPGFRALVSDDIPALATSKITTGTFGAAFLASDSVTTIKILAKNVTTAKIADSAVQALQIATDAIETAKIKDGNVTVAKLATDSVETIKIKNLAVTTSKLDTYAVETTKIKDANVTLAKLGTDVIVGGYVKESLIAPKYSSVLGYTVDGNNQLVLANLKLVFLTTAQLAAITKEANAYYVIID